MRKVLAGTLLVVALAFALAGCGSGKKAGSGPITVTGTTTIANVKTGVLITCKGGPGAKLPPPGRGVSASADGPSTSTALLVVHRQGGSVYASCTK